MIDATKREPAEDTAMPVPARTGFRPWGSALVRVSLTHKIVLANLALILVAVALCAVAAVHVLGISDPSRVTALFSVSGLLAVVATLPLHLALVRMALAPVTRLEDAAERVEAGDLAARVAASPLADPSLMRIAAAFNRLLDAVTAERDQLRAVAACAFRAQEAERQRLAVELQEEWAQRLAGVLLQLRATRSAAEPQVRDARVEVIRAEIQAVLSALRQHARGLHPPALRELGLVVALRSLVRTLDASAQLGLPEVILEGEEVAGLLSPDQELALYRIAQEALSNAIRHAGAARVEIRIRREGDAVEMMVTDDGCGFDVHAVELARKAVGLFGIRERALYANGVSEIRSSPGRGATVTVRVRTSREPASSPCASPSILPDAVEAIHEVAHPNT